MKKFLFLFFFFFGIGCFGTMEAQLKKTIEKLITPFEDTATVRNVYSDSLLVDSIKRELEGAKSVEMNLRMEIEQLKLVSYASDSLKLARQKMRIDSIRSVTRGYPVVVDEDTLFTVYAKRGGLSPADRAENFALNIERLGKSYKLNPDSVYIEYTDNVADVMYKDKVIASVTDEDALWQDTTRDNLAREYQGIIIQKLREIQKEHSALQLIKRILLFLFVIVLQYFLFRLTTYLYKKLKVRITKLKDTRLKPVKFHDYELFDTEKQVSILIFVSNIFRYILMLLQLLVTVPILFSIFPQTKNLAVKIFSYLWIPVKSILKGIVDYIPNFFTILVIYYAIRYVIKGLKYMAKEVESERLKIAGFYPDWAWPTYHIIRFLLYAFMIAMIYPYLPGSDSGVFQGVSVFIGLIVSLGSSTVIGNIIAGMVITYMRPFKLGDRIKLNDTVGNVIEKSAFVTRIKTPKNEMVTIPNSFIMSGHTTNYSASCRNFGLIIHSEVSIGYDVPWRKVHQLLIDAALNTQGVVPDPKPFVLETSLSDWYPVYQINAYVKDADKVPQIYSDMHQNVQDTFNKAGIEIMSPHYIATRDGNETTIPKTES
ncbi:mechanosensitive ion channel family protein [Coprobacter sp.]